MFHVCVWNNRPEYATQGSWSLWLPHNHCFCWNKILMLLAIKKIFTIWSTLNKITDACLSLQRTMLILVWEKSGLIHLLFQAAGKPHPSRRKQNCSQKERGPRLLFFTPGNNAALWEMEIAGICSRSCGHIHPKHVQTQDHVARACFPRTVLSRRVSIFQGFNKYWNFPNPSFWGM